MMAWIALGLLINSCILELRLWQTKKHAKEMRTVQSSAIESAYEAIHCLEMRSAKARGMIGYALEYLKVEHGKGCGCEPDVGFSEPDCVVAQDLKLALDFLSGCDYPKLAKEDVAILNALKSIENDDHSIPDTIWHLRNEAIQILEGRLARRKK